MKPIRLTAHAHEQCIERGTNEEEVRQAVVRGFREPAKMGRELCRLNFSFDAYWNDSYYAVKQVAPVVIEKDTEIIVITVYTFYF